MNTGFWELTLCINAPEIKSCWRRLIPGGGGGGTLNIYWWGCAAALKKGVLGTGTTPKRGVLGMGTSRIKKGGGVLGTGKTRKGGGGGLKNWSCKKEDFSKWCCTKGGSWELLYWFPYCCLVWSTGGGLSTWSTGGGGGGGPRHGHEPKKGGFRNGQISGKWGSLELVL